MHPISSNLKRMGRRILMHQIGEAFAISLAIAMAWAFLYGLGVLLIRTWSLTLTGILSVPSLALLGFLGSIPFFWWRLRTPRLVARYLENTHEELQLSLRSALDFMEGRADQGESSLSNAYINKVSQQIADFSPRMPQRGLGRYAVGSLMAAILLWGFQGDAILAKFFNPALSIGNTHLDLAEGSITIFEPEYTQIPGRTLPLKPGTFSVYPGAKVSMSLKVPENAKAVYIQEDDQAPVPLRNKNGNASHEMVFTQSNELRLLLEESGDGGRTEPFKFDLKVDEVPEIQLRSYTPEGPINIMDPLIVELEVKDDFGVKELHAVVQWDSQEKRIPIKVPAARKNHFITKNQWFLSDFDLGDTDRFSVYFEAADNNPINGPGLGRSNTLSYELESPDKKYDQFMEDAKALLDTMTHVLGDNLETELPAQLPQNLELQEAEVLGKNISSGLYRSLSLTNTLISKIRETPNLSRLDQNFLYTFRNGITRRARARSEMNLHYANLESRRVRNAYTSLLKGHNSEELGIEGLTYDLLLQLKMWAIFELERQNNELQNELDQMEELFENAEDMDEQELMEMFDKLWQEVMKDFQKMMADAANEMDMNMQEFMNSEALQDSTDKLQELREQIMEALKEGDMEKAKALMEELKAQMESAYKSMQESMGEMSPEMQAMMKNMNELSGLLKEIKLQEEALEADTRALKSKIDKEMGGNQMEMSQKEQEAHRKATERIHEMLTELYNKLVEYKAEDVSTEIVKQINGLKEKLDKPNIPPQEKLRIERDISEQERLLDFLARDGMDKLQEVTLKNLDQTEKLQEYLDQGELNLSLEAGLRLESSLMSGERNADRTASQQIREETKPAETFRESRQELYKILDALQQIKRNGEERRREYMESKGKQEQQKLSERQAEIQRMIEEFMKNTEESFGGSQIEQRLRDIARTMRGAEDKLGKSRLEGGLQREQDALQKIGEMMEQMQQSQRPSGRPNSMRFGRQTGNRGDPSLEDIFIPESEKQATRDQMKDAIRKRLEGNLPDAYGKEIRKYYEKLMDQ